MAVFPLLADIAGYRACDTDLLVDHAARAYWLDLFASHFIVQLDAAGSIGVSDENRRSAAEEWGDEIAAIQINPGRYGRLDILLLDVLRQSVLGRHGIHDEFRLVKKRENEAALIELAAWLDHLDQVEPGQRLERIALGMLAGNLFDMGVSETAGRFAHGSESLASAMARVPQRPWLFDHLDAAMLRWRQSPPRKAVIFADNAGGDAVLGVLPLAREFMRNGTEVILAANSTPSLNDITHHELADLVQRSSRIDPAFARPELKVVESGNAAPLIDLRSVSDQLAHESRDADLVALVGMGRGIESNWGARFTCDALRIAMIKDPQVAKTVGGKLHDAVFRYERPASRS